VNDPTVTGQHHGALDFLSNFVQAPELRRCRDYKLKRETKPKLPRIYT
jgi:hypothetical protein